ncbi:MAG: DUF4176 domain-containing protein [Oscillospiraceae bacterium]|nr:DUF4176 domain-containing protein [Oscillospiraceae bacterium]
MKKLFPIGTIVEIDGVVPRYMIIGHIMKESDSDRVWDYAAVPFPIGLLDPEKFLLFNHDKIKVLHFIGLQDTESLEYMKKLYFDINKDELKAAEQPK